MISCVFSLPQVSFLDTVMELFTNQLPTPEVHTGDLLCNYKKKSLHNSCPSYSVCIIGGSVTHQPVKLATHRGRRVGFSNQLD